MFDPIEPLEPASLDEFTQDSAAMIERLKETGQPQVLTVDGKSAVVVQDVAAYQRLLDRLDRAEATVGIRRGLDEMARGQGMQAEKVFAELRAKHGLSQEEPPRED